MFTYIPTVSEADSHTLGGLWTYFTVFFAFFVANVNVMTSVLGLVLLIIRLVYEIPKACAAIRSMREKKEHSP